MRVFTIPAHRLEIEKVWLDDFEVDEKALKSQLKKDLRKEPTLKSKSNQPSEKVFSVTMKSILHIENLVDSWNGLSNFEIVNIQLSFLRKRLFSSL